MGTRVEEVGDGIHQLATFVEEIDFGFNQYLVTGEEPLLFHTGLRHMFPAINEAVGRVVAVEELRWISFGHVEADECGSMNEWLAAAPLATVTQGVMGSMVSIGDMADRPPRPLGSGEVLDIGGHRMRWIDTPHVPHSWEAGVMFDETTGTLFCGDLFSQWGAYPATTSEDIVGQALDQDLGWMSLAPRTGTILRELAELDVTALAQMHGPVFTGDCRGALADLADGLEEAIAAAA